MCAPRKVLTIAAIAGLAVATGGLSVGATAGAAGATTASTAASTAALASEVSYVAGTTSTLSSLTTALKVGLKYANVAAPLIGASGMVYSGQVQKGILDAAYNLSYTEMVSDPMFTAAVKTGNKEEIFKNLLDTANVGGQSLKGLAKRRAASYNMANTTSKITAVEQKKDGTVNYYKGKAVFFAYAPKNGKHAKSTAGLLKI